MPFLLSLSFLLLLWVLCCQEENNDDIYECVKVRTFAKFDIHFKDQSIQLNTVLWIRMRSDPGRFSGYGFGIILSNFRPVNSGQCNVGRDGHAFLWTLRSRLPVLLDFSFAFPRSCMTFFSRSPVLPRSCFVFLVYGMCWGGGATHHTRAVCVWTDQGGGVNSPLRHYSPRYTCVVYESTGRKPVWGQTRVSSTIPPFHLSSQYTS